MELPPKNPSKFEKQKTTSFESEKRTTFSPEKIKASSKGFQSSPKKKIVFY